MANVVILSLTCPKEKATLYKKILLLFSKYGEEALKDCNAACSSANKTVVTCWNMFIAACAAYQGNEIKKANLIWKYIEGQLAKLYNVDDIYQETSIIIDIEQWPTVANEGVNNNATEINPQQTIDVQDWQDYDPNNSNNNNNNNGGTGL